jgi:hypothetical protein
VWLLHRAGAVVLSRAFHFMDVRLPLPPYSNPHRLTFISQNPDALIYLISSLAFASRTELGWDPTIIRQLDEMKKNIVYRITVHTSDNTTEDYVTTAIISDFAANSIPAPGTRVFEVQKLGGSSPRPPCILKDSWLRFDRPHEGQVMKTLMGDLSKVQGMNMNYVKQHFLTVLCYGSVLVEGKVDSTLAGIMHDADIPVESLALRLVPADESPSQRSSKGSQAARALANSLSPPVWSSDRRGEVPNYAIGYIIELSLKKEGNLCMRTTTCE